MSNGESEKSWQDRGGQTINRRLDVGVYSSKVGPREGFEQGRDMCDLCSKRIPHCYVGILL